MAYPLLITIVFPLGGLIAAKKYNEYLTKLYSTFLILLIFVQVITMIILPGTAYIVVQTLFILFELFVTIISIKAAILMDKLTSQEWASLQAD